MCSRYLSTSSTLCALCFYYVYNRYCTYTFSSMHTHTQFCHCSLLCTCALSVISTHSPALRVSHSLCTTPRTLLPVRSVGSREDGWLHFRTIQSGTCCCFIWRASTSQIVDSGWDTGIMARGSLSSFPSLAIMPSPEPLKTCLHTACLVYF